MKKFLVFFSCALVAGIIYTFVRVWQKEMDWLSGLLLIGSFSIFLYVGILSIRRINKNE